MELSEDEFAIDNTFRNIRFVRFTIEWSQISIYLLGFLNANRW